jgi:hypothetical protein
MEKVLKGWANEYALPGSAHVLITSPLTTSCLLRARECAHLDKRVPSEAQAQVELCGRDSGELPCKGA